MRFLLYAKHWQIFLLAFLIPAILITIGLIDFMTKGNTILLLYTAPLGVVLSQVTLYAWLWAVGNNLTDNETKKQNTTLFKSLIIIPFITLIIILIFMFFVTFRINTGVFSMYNVLITSLLIIIPVQFIFIISMFYCFYFTARAIKTSR